VRGNGNEERSSVDEEKGEVTGGKDNSPPRDEQ
jgi:hypothetical protein